VPLVVALGRVPCVPTSSSFGFGDRRSLSEVTEGLAFAEISRAKIVMRVAAQRGIIPGAIGCFGAHRDQQRGHSDYQQGK
jgi:hypothetical protein